MVFSHKRFLSILLLTFSIAACASMKKSKKDSSKAESGVSETATGETPDAARGESKSSDTPESEVSGDSSASRPGVKPGNISDKPVADAEKKSPNSKDRLKLLEERLDTIDKKLEALYKFQSGNKISLKTLAAKQTAWHAKTDLFEERLLSIAHLTRELDEKLGKRIDNRRSQEHADERSIYEGARKLFRSGNYVDAVIMFKKYLSLFPQSTLADNAQYWIGEGYYSRGEYRRALEEFDKVFNFSDKSKVPDALLKKGYCYIHMKDNDNARNIFSLIIDKFSGNQTEYAIVDSAKRKLTEIKGKK